MQKRLVRKLELEMLLSQVAPHPSPKPNLEQYTIPADVATTMLRIAAYTYGDIVGKVILDLGCGTGRLALGAAFLDAKQVVGVDIDKEAVMCAHENSKKANLQGKVQWIAGDVNVVRGSFDTILQNPPFGIQNRNADRKFLEKALEVGKVIYSLHKGGSKVDGAFVKRLKATGTGVVPSRPSPFLEKFIAEHGGKIKATYTMVMMVPHMFAFHTKRKHEFAVDLLIIEGR
jgi:putative methylase